MNWLFYVVIGIICAAAIVGAYKGMLRLLFSLIAIVLVIGVASYAAPKVSDFLQTNTQLGSRVSQRVVEKLEASVESSVENAANQAQGDLELTGVQLPEILSDLFFEKTVTGIEGAISQSGIYETVGQEVAGVVLMVVSFLIALILAVVIVTIIGKLTDLVNKVPVLGGINRFLGFLGGGFLGFVIVWAIFLVITLMAASELGQTLIACIRENAFLSMMYDENLLLKLMVGFLSA